MTRSDLVRWKACYYCKGPSLLTAHRTKTGLARTGPPRLAAQMMSDNSKVLKRRQLHREAVAPSRGCRSGGSRSGLVGRRSGFLGVRHGGSSEVLVEVLVFDSHREGCLG